MKSRATAKREVTRHVISCTLLLNDGSLVPSNCKALIYFLTTKELKSYSETISYFLAIKTEKTDPLSKESVPIFRAEKKI